jgi:polyadenylate-binding protein 2
MEDEHEVYGVDIPEDVEGDLEADLEGHPYVKEEDITSDDVASKVKSLPSFLHSRLENFL